MKKDLYELLEELRLDLFNAININSLISTFINELNVTKSTKK